MLGTERPVSRIGEDRIREAFEHAAAGMAITDFDGHFQETNFAYNQIVGRAEEDLRHETIFSVTHEDDRENCQCELRRLLSGEVSSFVVEKRYLRPSGEAVWVRNSFSLLKNPSGHATHIIMICEDITERRRAERLLLESEKLATVGQLTSSIAHEINDPLEVVMNLLFLVQESESLDEAHRYAAEADLQVRHVAQIATDTLRFRKDAPMPVLTDATELLRSVLTLYKGKLAQAHVRVRLDKHDEPAMVCYPGEIRQVFANLIRNAVDAMPKGGELRIRVKAGTDWRTGSSGVRVTLADTGNGISSEVRDRIYEPFFTTKGNVGTGLGLWVSARILAKHRGSMHLRSSDTPGNSWTAFTLIFPSIGAQGEAAGLGEIR